MVDDVVGICRPLRNKILLRRGLGLRDRGVRDDDALGILGLGPVLFFVTEASRVYSLCSTAWLALDIYLLDGVAAGTTMTPSARDPPTASKV